MENKNDIKEFVKDRYAQIAAKSESCGSCCSSCSPDYTKQAESIGYSKQEIDNIPDSSVMGLGCGNPTALAELKEGEIVVDLGSGGGIDVFLAAQKVGKTGKVIGIDMTPEMIMKAEKNAMTGGYNNVSFKLGEIEQMPLEDDSADVIISNCVINLATDKLAVFKEMFRVLKTGGRFIISDFVTDGGLPEEIRKSAEAWAGCIAGALEKQEYLDIIRKAGFKEIEVTGEKTYDLTGMDKQLDTKIISVHVKAFK